MSAIPDATKYETTEAKPSRAPMHLIEADAALAANCFTVGLDGQVMEGFNLSFNEPSKGKIALVLSKDVCVMRDALGRGPIYTPRAGQPHVRRAQIGEIVAKSGRNIKLLRQPGADAPTLVLVDEPVHEKGKLYAGLGLGVHRVAHAPGKSLVEMKSGDTLLLFYPDGAVRAVQHDALGNMATAGWPTSILSDEDAAKARIEHAGCMIELVAGEKGEDEIKKKDRWFHELADILAKFPNQKALVFVAVGHAVKHFGDGKLNSGVRKHFVDVLGDIGDTSRHWWLKG